MKNLLVNFLKRILALFSNLFVKIQSFGFFKYFFNFFLGITEYCESVLHNINMFWNNMSDKQKKMMLMFLMGVITPLAYNLINVMVFG